MASAVDIKICGVTTLSDAKAAVDLGATHVGINLIPASPRFVARPAALEMARALRGSAVVVAVVTGLPKTELETLLAVFDRVQLHGDDAPELVTALDPRAYKAERIGGPDDVARARKTPGAFLLVDAKSPRGLGGTGERFDWHLVQELAKERPIGLAGGLTPDNVAEAVRMVRPAMVDVASGVEAPGDPRKKDLARVRAFIAAARGA